LALGTRTLLPRTQALNALLGPRILSSSHLSSTLNLLVKGPNCGSEPDRGITITNILPYVVKGMDNGMLASKKFRVALPSCQVP
jgi:hypothetical protein